MKKEYMKPEVCVVVLRQSQMLLAGSPFTEMNSESGGGIDSDTKVDTGLSRVFDIDDDFDFDE
jgi:hypothetical protein